MSDALTMAATARAVGLSAERFRKVWHTWHQQLGFPAPFAKPPCSYAWRAEAVEEWKAARERAFGAGNSTPANDDASPLYRAGARPSSRLKRERAQLMRLMHRGA